MENDPWILEGKGGGAVKIDPEGPRRTKKNPVRLSKLRQTSQAAFAASSFSSWFNEKKYDCYL